MLSYAGRALDELGGVKLTKLNQTTNGVAWSLGVRRWGISSIVERETTQNIS